jgi:hypothetical protein
MLKYLTYIPGYVSRRDINKGSWYVQALTKELKNWKTGGDLLSLLTRVNSHMVEDFKTIRFNVECGQTPVFVSSLNKKIFYK